MVSRTAAALALLLAPLAASPSAAEDRFQIRLLGVPVGTLVIDQSHSPGSFDAQSRFATTGVASVVRDVRFTMRSTGYRKAHLPVPRAYGEQMNTGTRRSDSTFRFARSDTRWDPNTALVYALTGRPRAAGCRLDRTLFDGERSNRLVIREAARSGDRLTCTGSMSRTGGYSPEDMARWPRHEFTLTYRDDGGQLVFAGAEAQTIYGKVAILPH